ncbi:MAG: glutamyl-tRNA reductase [Proteobacteria bacterium]|nr:glutamyl-tRNA reductase [Pseudomonadota bacterium]
MPLVVVGINHRTAPLEVREKVVFDPSHLPDALRSLAGRGARETVIVSTCNRTELYCVADAPAELARWLESYHAVDFALRDCLYQHEEHGAIGHAFAVASGLDSMVLGEPQILGQLKDAYRAAQDAGTVGPLLNRLFQATFSVAKRVRTETQIGANAVSVAYAAVSLARQIFAGFGQHTALLVGAGETIALAARHLHSQGLKRMIIANRSLDRAQLLAAEFNASAITLDALPTHLADADIVVSSTASPTVVIGAADVEAALAARRRRPMFMVDIAVPRDIDPAVAAFEDVYLYTIDDLQNFVTQNLKAREDGAREARILIDEEVARFLSGLRGQQAVPTIRELRTSAESIRATTLEQARRLIGAGRTPEEALAYLADTLTHRLIHPPTHELRQAGEAGDEALVAAARRLFRLDADAE